MDWRTILRVVALIAILSSNHGLVFGAVQTTFDFRSDFWVNLHHTLYNQAVVRKAGHSPDLSALNPGENPNWGHALDYYEHGVIEHDLLEMSMITINRALADARDAASLYTSQIPKPLVEILEAAASVYRAHWWAEHDRRNQEWVDQITPLVGEYEKTLRPALSRAYNTAWPKGRIRVEMSYYTTGKSAYTSLGPTIITISSWSQRNAGPAGLETLFHEAGHGLIQKVTKEIAMAENRTDRKPAESDLWHAIIFYTTGELVQRCVPTLTPYAMKYGMWQHNWPNTFAVLEMDWKPFLEGKGRFKDAIDRVIADLD